MLYESQILFAYIYLEYSVRRLHREVIPPILSTHHINTSSYHSIPQSVKQCYLGCTIGGILL